MVTKGYEESSSFLSRQVLPTMEFFAAAPEESVDTKC